MVNVALNQIHHLQLHNGITLNVVLVRLKRSQSAPFCEADGYLGKDVGEFFLGQTVSSALAARIFKKNQTVGDGNGKFYPFG